MVDVWCGARRFRRHRRHERRFGNSGGGSPPPAQKGENEEGVIPVGRSGAVSVVLGLSSGDTVPSGSEFVSSDSFEAIDGLGGDIGTVRARSRRRQHRGCILARISARLVVACSHCLIGALGKEGSDDLLHDRV